MASLKDIVQIRIKDMSAPQFVWHNGGDLSNPITVYVCRCDIKALLSNGHERGCACPEAVKARGSK